MKRILTIICAVAFKAHAQCETWSRLYILKQIIMATMKPKKTKIEDKFVEKFLEERDETSIDEDCDSDI